MQALYQAAYDGDEAEMGRLVEGDGRPIDEQLQGECVRGWVQCQYFRATHTHYRPDIDTPPKSVSATPPERKQATPKLQ